MINKNSKILVTGGTGFVGAHIVHALVKNGYQFVTTTRRHSSDPSLIENLSGQIEIIEADITDLSSMIELIDSFDAVIHAAALVSFVGADKKKMFMTNVVGTENIVNTCLDSQIKKLVFISSAGAIGRTMADNLIDEETKWVKNKLNTHYAISKHSAERHVWRAYHEGLPCVILNPTLILGPGFWNRGSSKIIKRVHEGLRYFPPGKTGLVDVRDVAEICIKALERDIAGERFICNGVNISYRKLFSKISGELKVKAPKKQLNPILKGLAWRYYSFRSLLSGNKPIVTRETMLTAFNSFKYTNEKSMKYFDFKYRHIDDTIKYSCDSYLDSIEKGMDHANII